MGEAATRDISAVLRQRVVPTGGSRHGLVIGIEKYRDPRLNLRCARHDAQAIYDLMTDSSCGMFPAANVKLLLDDQATRDNIWRAFSALRKNVNEGDTVWIYFAGHGAPERSDSYWVTHDADVDDLFGTGLSNEQITGVLSSIAARRLVVLLDCCHAAAIAARKNSTRDVLNPESLLAAYAGEGRLTLSSSKGTEKSVELSEHGHGAFTYFLTKGLRGEADRDGDGVVTADELWDYLRGKVTEASRKAGCPQTPVRNGEMTHDLALSVNALALDTKERIAKAISAHCGWGDDKLTTPEAEFCLDILRRGPQTEAEQQLAAEFDSLARGATSIATFRRLVRIASLSGTGPGSATPAVPSDAQPERDNTNATSAGASESEHTARHDVFISHSTEDKVFADAVVDALERDGITCWVAPRDIRPGTTWMKGIMEGITGARLMVLVLSSHANASKHVVREVERAANRKMPVLPVRIEDVKLCEELEYLISSSQWMDARSGPTPGKLHSLTSQVRALLADAPGKAVPQTPPPIPSIPVQVKPQVTPPAIPPPPRAAGPKRRSWLLPVGLSVGAVVAIVAAVTVYLVRRVSPERPSVAVAQEIVQKPTPAPTPTPSPSPGPEPLPIPEPPKPPTPTPDQHELPDHRSFAGGSTANPLDVLRKPVTDDPAKKEADEKARKQAEDEAAQQKALEEAQKRTTDITLQNEKAEKELQRAAEIAAQQKIAEEARKRDLAAQAQRDAIARANFEKQTQISRLLDQAARNADKTNGHTALSALGDVLKLDPANAEALRLKEKINGFYTFVNSSGRRFNLVSDSIGMEFVEIAPGAFVVGSALGQDETPHRVALTRRFAMARQDVTRGQFATFVAEQHYQTYAEKVGGAYALKGDKWPANGVKGACWKNPGFEQTDNHPVVCVTWNDAQAFCTWLSRKDGRRHRLPTEAEWEIGCRAGTKTAYPWGDDPAGGKDFCNAADLHLTGTFASWRDHFAWDDGYVYTAPVGRFRPNDFGLFDMLGNVNQWCGDNYGPYPASATDPTGPASGSQRVIRGGSWASGPDLCRSAHRGSTKPDAPYANTGFRCVMELP